MKHAVNDLKKPAIVYIPGFLSGRDSTDAVCLSKICRDSGHDLLCYDPSGIAQSRMEFKDAGMSAWVEDAVNMIGMMQEATGQAPLVIGQSMGGAVAAFIAKEKLCEFHSLVLLCPAINYGDTFTQMICSVIPKEDQDAFKRGENIRVDLGSHEDWEPFYFSLRFHDDFMKHHWAKEKDIIKAEFPVRVVQGMDDITIPYTATLGLGLENMFSSNDLEITLVKECSHQIISDSNGSRVVARTISDLISE